MISFCDYAFLFDLKAKIRKFAPLPRFFTNERRSSIVLLQYHGQLEMQEAIRNAFLHNFQTMLGNHLDTVNPLLMLHVHRETIVQDTISQVSACDRPTFPIPFLLAHSSWINTRTRTSKSPCKFTFTTKKVSTPVAYARNSFFCSRKKFSIPSSACSVSARRGDEHDVSFSRVAVYNETNTIWFSDYYVEEEEAMYKLIGVSRSRLEKSIRSALFVSSSADTLRIGGV